MTTKERFAAAVFIMIIAATIGYGIIAYQTCTARGGHIVTKLSICIGPDGRLLE